MTTKLLCIWQINKPQCIFVFLDSTHSFRTVTQTQFTPQNAEGIARTLSVTSSRTQTHSFSDLSFRQASIYITHFPIHIACLDELYKRKLPIPSWRTAIKQCLLFIGSTQQTINRYRLLPIPYCFL